MLRRLIGEDVELATVARRPSVGAVRADPGQIEQVLMNLAVNARDAMPDGGTPDDRDRPTRPWPTRTRPTREVWRPGDYVTLLVADTGAGMTAETQAHMFEPFFTTKDVGQGHRASGWRPSTGSSSRAAGTSQSTATLGEGTTLHDLPARVWTPSRRRVAAAGARGPRPSATETMLLVEDEPSVRRLTRRDARGPGLHGASRRRPARRRS